MSLFSVTKRAPELVGPSEPTPGGHRPFSPNDDTDPALRFFLEMILVFGRGRGDHLEPVKAVREALARALVPYYPVAGRIVADAGDASKLQVACTGEGAWFVEASAGCSLAVLEYMENQPHLVPKAQLLPSPPQGVDHKAVPFMMQVLRNHPPNSFSISELIHCWSANCCYLHCCIVNSFLAALGQVSHPHSRCWCRWGDSGPSGEHRSL